jgi:hypothetical protein
MQEWIDKGLLPVKNKQSLFLLVRKLRDRDEIPSSWGRTGRPCLVATDNFPSLIGALEGQRGLSLNIEGVEAVIVRVRKETLQECGLQPLGEHAVVSRTSLINFMAIIHATVPVISAVETTIPKTNSRHIAEHSLMAAVSLLLTI